MTTIITQPGRLAHPDEAARRRRDRLARTTAGDMKSALAFLSMIDPSGTQEIYDPGHHAEATWLLPGEDPGEL